MATVAEWHLPVAIHAAYSLMEVVVQKQSRPPGWTPSRARHWHALDCGGKRSITRRVTGPAVSLSCTGPPPQWLPQFNVQRSMIQLDSKRHD